MAKKLSGTGAITLSALRATVETTTTPATVAETTIALPIVPSQRLAVRIKRIYGILDMPDLSTIDAATAAAVRFRANASLSARQGQTGPPSWGAAGTLFNFQRDVLLASLPNGGATGVGFGVSDTGGNFEFDFGDGLIVADSTLSLYLNGDVTAMSGAAPAAMNAAIGVRIIILYDLVQLTTDEYVGALSILETL